jgi:hydrogenase nickel incorporation protein HypB
MCVVCGCGSPSMRHGENVAGSSPGGSRAPGGKAHGVLHYSGNPAGMSVPGISPTRAVQIEADILGENNRLARRNRAHFLAHGVTAFNLMSSPGSGKTTLLCASIAAIRSRHPGLPLAVIEGDQQTSVDAERIRATGADAIQVNTGRGCHLDAQMVGDAFARFDLHAAAHRAGSTEALLFIENVGNLVCPAMWDLGEAAKVVVLSVTEGDDKPLKYPDMFAASALMVINKIDLLAHVDFDVERCIAHARRVNPDIDVLLMSATRGDGMAAWVNWLIPEPVARAGGRS